MVPPSPSLDVRSVISTCKGAAPESGVRGCEVISALTGGCDMGAKGG
jgi:hypothetical protein